MSALSRIPCRAVYALAALSISSVAFAQSAQQCAVNNRAYAARSLTSNGTLPAAHTDADLRGPWGVAVDPDGFVWVSDKGSGRITLYDGTGQRHFISGLPFALRVPLRGNEMDPGQGAPTGAAYLGAKGDPYDTADFSLCSIHALCGMTQFVFAGRDGIIYAFGPPGTGENVAPVVVNSARQAVYTGITTGANNVARQLYAADFRNRRIDVVDGRFQPVERAGAFQDSAIPVEYGPFGIQNIAGDIYVTYARRHPTTNNHVDGPGAGYINVFDAAGTFIRRLVTRGALNAPWGMALAPKSFGCLGGSLLVSNFGDGTINAYDLRSGAFLGALTDGQGQALKIAGLRGIAFGNGLNNQPTNTLFFTAAPGSDGLGIYGAIDPAGL